MFAERQEQVVKDHTHALATIDAALRKRGAEHPNTVKSLDDRYMLAELRGEHLRRMLDAMHGG